ncbi:MAG: hypothetical protein R3E32_21395 [Chitinophagales bacterium]
MTLQQSIIREIQTIDEVNVLLEIQNFLQKLRLQRRSHQSNMAAVLQLAGSIDDEEAREMRVCIDSEFNKIEGEW